MKKNNSSIEILSLSVCPTWSLDFLILEYFLGGKFIACVYI